VAQGSVVQQGMSERKLMLPGTGRGHGDHNPARTDPHQRADLEQFQPHAAATGLGELGVGQTDAAQRAEQHGSVKNLGCYAASWIGWWPKRPSSSAALT
jgi:hypothetical protein